MSKESSEYLMYLAHQQINDGNLMGASMLFNKAVMSTPNDPEIFCERGLFHLKIKLIEEAIYDFSQAIKINPNKFIYHYNLGCAYYDIKDYEKAIFCYSNSIKLNSKDSNSYTNRGNCYIKIKEKGKAKADYESAINIDPGDKIAYNAKMVMIVDEWKNLVFKGNLFSTWTYDHSCSLEELESSGYPFSMACFPIHDYVIIAIGMDRSNQTPKNFIEENQDTEFKLDLQKERKVLDTMLGKKIVYYAKKYNL